MVSGRFKDLRYIRINTTKSPITGRLGHQRRPRRRRMRESISFGIAISFQVSAFSSCELIAKKQLKVPIFLKLI